MGKNINNKTQETKLTATGIIAKRKELDMTISKYWKIIHTENVVEKGYKRNYDLNKILQEIYKETTNRAIYKVYQQCINLGIKRISQLEKSNNFFNIYMLSEKRELLVLLSKTETLDFKTKVKNGKKNLDTTEIISSTQISKLKKKLNLEILELLNKIEDFNSTAELVIDNPNFLAY